MEYIQLKNGDKISRIALGTSRLHDDEKSVNTILKAMDCGINMLNCADFYNSGDGELAVRQALKHRKREDLFISVKFGGLMCLGRQGMTGVDVSPEHVENYLAYTLKRIGIDYVDLYQPSRINPHIPVEETIGAVVRLKEKGFVRHIGMTQIDAETLRKGNQTTEISLVELNYNLMDRRFEDTTMAEARKHQIPIAAFGVLLAGLIGGNSQEQTRQMLKHMAENETLKNIERNMAVKDQLQAIADKNNITLAQLAMAWVLAQGDDLSAIIGSHIPEQIENSAEAVNIKLSPIDLDAIEKIIPKTEARSIYMRDLKMNEKGIFKF